MVKSDISITKKDNLLQLSTPREATNALIEIKERQVNDFIIAGYIFKLVKENKWWEKEGAESFNSYIAEVGYDRTTAYKMMLVYETFVEPKLGKKSKQIVDSNQQLREAGWVKLAKVAPHVNKDNYEFMLELASSNSLSDIDKELVRQNYVTKKEPQPEFFECPRCHKVSEITKRTQVSFSRKDYNEILDKYQELKEMKLSGKEFDAPMQTIKTMFMNRRTKEEIIAVMEYMADQDEYSWTINTVKNKIAEILPLVKEKTEPMTEFEKKWRNK